MGSNSNIKLEKFKPVHLLMLRWLKSREMFLNGCEVILVDYLASQIPRFYRYGIDSQLLVDLQKAYRSANEFKKEFGV